MKSKTFQAFFAFILALLVIIIINLLTNRVDQLGGHSWDFIYYKDMVQNGFLGNNHLVVPYAYRFLTPLTVSFIMKLTHYDLTKAFKTLSVICMLAQLFGVYLLSRQLKFRFGTSIVLMLVVAFSLFNVKFLLFDPYRPDPLAYPLLLFAMILFLRRQYFGCILISIIGLFVREALILPILICMFYLLKEWLQNRNKPQPLIQFGVIAVFTALALVLPRALIPVHGTQQVLDPINDPKFFKVLFGTWLDLKKWFNLIFNVVAYFLPILLVFTPARWRESWRRIGPLKPALYIYLAGAFFIIMYGGTDMMRYVTYLFIPLILILGNMLEQGVSYLESGFMLLATFLFNKILFQFPVWDFNAYLDFHGGYDSRITPASYTRWVEWFAYSGLAWTWRKVVTGLNTSAQPNLLPHVLDRP
jgi:hypothetical protein